MARKSGFGFRPSGGGLCYGFLHNCLIAPITGLPVVDWEYLLTAMGFLLGVSGVRDIGLKERKKQDVVSDNKPLE